MSDAGNVSPRTSAILNRPHAPAGPRTRWSSLRASGPLSIDPPASATLPQDAPMLGAMSPSPTFKPLPAHPKPLPVPALSHGNSQSAALPMDRPSSLTSSEPSTQSKYLPAVNEEKPTSPTVAPAYNHSQPDTDTSSRSSPASELSFLPPKVTVMPQPLPKLTPPPPISFDSVAVPWKAMPLEPALWTFDSAELQNIVSRAIRMSAKESFLRLLTVDNLDSVLPAELARLKQLKTTTQARYRFLVHRRTMLFHALNTSSIGQKKGDEPELLVSQLTTQLVETITDCDQRLEELFRINDQIAQINKLLDVHSSSALAVALRKLNSSYARRTRDLNKARQRIFQLEAEIEDAWKEAEKLANELDEYENCGTDDAVIERAELVSVPRSPSQSPPPLTDRRISLPMPMTPTLLAVKTISSLSPVLSNSPPHQSASASPVMHFVFPPPVPKDKPSDDAVSIKSSKSTRTVKSSKSGKGYTSSLHAAKIRSSRASHSSLRLSIGGVPHHGRGPSEDVPPPMPEIPLHFVDAVYSPGATSSGKGRHQSQNVSTTSGSTALHYVTVSRLTYNSDSSLQFRQTKRQTSLDTLPTNKKRGSAAVDAYRGKAADDIYVMAGESSHGHYSTLQPSRSPFSYVDMSWDDDSDIQAVPRTPPYRSMTISHQIQGSDIPPLPPPKDPLQTVPVWWKTSNVVKDRSPGGQLPATSDLPLPSLPEFGVLRHSVLPQNTGANRPSTDRSGLLGRSKTLVMLKGFTKRYSASILHGKPSLKKTG